MKKFMKKILGTVGAAAMLCSSAFASVAINSTNFPSATFRSYVSANFDKNSDGTLSDAEIAKVHSISAVGMSSVNLKGIENFTALRNLYRNYSVGSTSNLDFNSTNFKTAYGLDCDIDDSYLLIMHIEKDGKDGLLTPMILDIVDTSTGDLVLKMPLYLNQTLEGISFMVKGKLNTEVHVYP